MALFSAFIADFYLRYPDSRMPQGMRPVSSRGGGVQSRGRALPAGGISPVRPMVIESGRAERPVEHHGKPDASAAELQPNVPDRRLDITAIEHVQEFTRTQTRDTGCRGGHGHLELCGEPRFVRVFVPSSTIEQSAGFALTRPTPLLEEERHALVPARSLNTLDPLSVYRARTWTTLASDDGPMNALQIDRSNWTKERFEGYEPKCEREPNAICRTRS
jgi:hypothetical protein